MRSRCVATWLESTNLIGRKADSTATYGGHVTLQDVNGFLQITRTIEGKTTNGVARFDTVAGDDKIPVLRIHFHFDGREYDATYRWQSDPDNYPRFTGYVYRAGTKSPGLEALFQSTDDDNIFGTRRRFRFLTWVFDVNRASL